MVSVYPLVFRAFFSAAAGYFSVLSRSKRHLLTDRRTVSSPALIRAVASVRGIDGVKNGGKLLQKINAGCLPSFHAHLSTAPPPLLAIRSMSPSVKMPTTNGGVQSGK